MAESHEEENPFLSLFEDESHLLAVKRKRVKSYRELSDCFRKIFLITGEKFKLINLLFIILSGVYN